MKPARFAYYAPERLDDVLALLDDDDRDVRVLAGGQPLVPMMNFRLAAPDALVDLRRVTELRYVRVGAAGALEVGAGIRQAELLRDLGVRAGWSLLAEGVRHIGHPQIRSRGTVCGSLAHHDPHAELPALAFALGATMTIADARGRRTVTAEDFFVSYYEVALGPGEMLIEVAFPPYPADSRGAFRELTQRRGDFALVGVAASLARDSEGRVAEPRSCPSA
jgi:carbon-monoxide dehydrogenase medium subunit